MAVEGRCCAQKTCCWASVDFERSVSPRLIAQARIHFSYQPIAVFPFFFLLEFVFCYIFFEPAISLSDHPLHLRKLSCAFCNTHGDDMFVAQDAANIEGRSIYYFAIQFLTVSDPQRTAPLVPGRSYIQPQQRRSLFASRGRGRLPPTCILSHVARSKKYEFMYWRPARTRASTIERT